MVDGCDKHGAELTMETARPYDHLLFDVMATLVYEPFFREVPAFFGIELGELIPQLRPGSWVDFELGKIDETTFFERFFADGRKFDGPGMKAAMVEAYAWLDGVELVLAELEQAGWPLHLLSNYPPWYQLIEDKLSISRYAAWTFVSCETALRKPDPDVYRGAAKHLGAAPERLLFIDDRENNCASAREVGLDAIVFENATQLRRELMSRNVL